MPAARPVRSLLVTATTGLLALTACSTPGDDDGGSPATATESTPRSDAGQRLVFQSGAKLWLLAAGGEAVALDTGTSGVPEHPDWSPDGASVLFESDATTLWSVVPGEPATVLAECRQPCVDLYGGAWSPAGDTVAFVRISSTDGVHTDEASVVEVSTDGTERAIATDRSGNAWFYDPRWSPDGSRLVVGRERFASRRLDEDTVTGRELVVVENGAVTVLPGTRGAMTPDWSPDGGLIVFERAGNLFTLTTAGGAAQALTAFDTSEESAIQPTFTPDGSRVVFCWITGVRGHGESTRAGLVDLTDGSIEVVEGSEGATHPRLAPSPGA